MLEVKFDDLLECSVTISYSRCAIISELHVTNHYGLPLEFAFYLYKNRKKVQVAWYSKSDKVIFDIGREAGDFEVLAFARLEQTKSISNI